MTSYGYRIHGLGVESDVPLAGHRHPLSKGERDVRIVGTGPRDESGRIASHDAPDVVAERVLGARRHYTVLREGRDLRIVFEGALDAVVSPRLGEIRWSSVPGLPQGVVSLLISGTAVALYLLARGECVLHASAVHVDGAVTAFIGPSGSGKSTLAAAMCAAGATLMSDDVLRVDADGLAHRGATSLRLRDAAGDLEGQLGERLATRTTPDGRRSVELPAPVEKGRLGRLLVPSFVPGDQPVRVIELRGASRMVALARAWRVGSWIDAPAFAAGMRDQARLARIVPMAVLEVPSLDGWEWERTRDLSAAIGGPRSLEELT